MSMNVKIYGNPDADTLLLQMVDDHDMEVIEQEVSYICNYSGEQEFCLKAVKVNCWNRDLSPWAAPAVFGHEDFGDGACRTLELLLKEVIPASSGKTDDPKSRIFLGGYSLAGLFALWACYQTDCFDGIAAASPSVWFPHFTDYMRDHEIRTGAVYLSLGDREERTRHPVMSQVGNAVRTGYEILNNAGADCFLEWNHGGHFKDPDQRTAKAFAWLMNRQRQVG